MSVPTDVCRPRLDARLVKHQTAWGYREQDVLQLLRDEVIASGQCSANQMLPSIDITPNAALQPLDSLDHIGHQLPERAEFQGQCGIVGPGKDVALRLPALRVLLWLLPSSIPRLPVNAHALGEDDGPKRNALQQDATSVFASLVSTMSEIPGNVIGGTNGPTRSS